VLTGAEQVLYLVVVPAAIVAAIWALASIGGPHARRRYRPGRPYQFTPVWYLANHRIGAPAASARPQLPPGGNGDNGPQGTLGGASDRW
jgi:hypothetical protein